MNTENATDNASAGSGRIRREWAPAEVARLRELAGHYPLEEVARQLGRSYSSVKNAARHFGADSGRAWTQAQLDRLRADYGRVPARRLAAALGRPLAGVYRMALKLGLGRPRPRFTAEDLARISELNGQGFPDAEVARRLGRDRHEVTRHRKRLGLPSHQRGQRVRARLAEALRRQLGRLGLGSAAELRRQAHRGFARRYGLPEDLPPRAVLIVLRLLERGVMTRKDIHDAVDAPWRGGRGSLLCNATGTSYLGELQRRGLLARVHRRSSEPGARRLPDLYLLTPAALDLLAAAARREKEEAPDDASSG